MIKTMKVAVISAKEKVSSIKDWKALTEKADYFDVKLNTETLTPEETKEIGAKMALAIKENAKGLDFGNAAILSAVGNFEEVKKMNGKIKIKASADSYFAITPVKNMTELAEAVTSDCNSVLAADFKKRAYTEGVWKE